MEDRVLTLRTLRPRSSALAIQGPPSAPNTDTSSSKVDVVDTSTLKKMGGRQARSKTRHKKNPQKIFKCQECSFYSDSQNLLFRHMKIHSDIRPHKCHFCERAFKTSTQLKTHINTHTGVKPYKCQEDNCEMAFITNGELTRHTRYCHTHEKPFKCTMCDYASVEVSKLRVHFRSHTGERPYECDECGKAFIKNFHLKRHRMSHTGEKPYKCPDCDQRFTQRSSLKSHITQQHLKTAPKFICEICDTQLGKKSDLNVHMRKQHAHQEEPLQCRYCDKLFHDRWSLMQHQRTHRGYTVRQPRSGMEELRKRHLINRESDDDDEEDHEPLSKLRLCSSKVMLDDDSKINKVTEHNADSVEEKEGDEDELQVD